MLSTLCLLLFSRLVEDCVIQLQETGEDVEGLEEEAVCLPDVLILSVWTGACLPLSLSARQSTSILWFYPETNCGRNNQALTSGSITA